MLNGSAVENNFDIFAAAGATAKAIDRNFTVVATNGLISIQLVPVTSNPKISGIEIALASSSEIRINAGSTTPYFDPQGLVWGADIGFSGNTGAYVTTTAISNTSTPAIYQSERYASGGTLQLSNYRLPMEPTT